MSLKDKDKNKVDKEHYLASSNATQRWRDSMIVVGMSFLFALVTVQVWCQTAPANPAPPGTTAMQPVPVTNVAPTTQSNGASAQPDSQQPGDDQGTAFVFKTEVREVILHATVVDEQRHLVTNLDRLAFTTFEDGAAQKTTAFHRDDVPVAMGIVIDNSGSMREKRDKVNKAVLNLIRASNPDDEIFVVNFGQDFYLDQDFTSDIDLLQRALQKVSTQGSTALYDAIVASAVHLKNNTRVERKILLVITDGRDNASQETLQEAMRQLQQKDGPTLYAIGLLGGELKPSDSGALRSLADSTGGVAFFPEGLDEVDDITRTMARDLRSQYTIGYKPTNSSQNGAYRVIEVRAQAPGHRKLMVRTRSGYYPGDTVH